MNCKFCDAELEQNQNVCHICGTEQTEEEPARMTEQKPKKNVAPLVLSIIAAVASLTCLAILLLMAFGVSFTGNKDNNEEGKPSVSESIPTTERPAENSGSSETEDPATDAEDHSDHADAPVQEKDMYTVEDALAMESADVVVATMGDKVLTNAQLQIYYRMQVLDFLNYYGGYASQLGLDLTLPLGEQPCYFDSCLTWEQYLLQIAVETWQNYQVIGLLAEEANYVLDDEWRESLEKLPAEFAAQAEEGEYESVDAMMQAVIGPSCTQDTYMEYIRLAYTCNAYYNSISEQMMPSDEEIDAYYEENKVFFEEEGILKTMGNIADVRHILICPKNGVTDEITGQMVYSDEEWAECLARAQKVLDEWKAGEATEESFIKLVPLHTEDSGSSATGGLYEDIIPGDRYVENFLNWAIDMNRQKGDTGIVQSEYGYHIMYYVDGEPYWKNVAGTQLQAERITEMTDAAEEKWPMDVDYTKAALSAIKLS